MEIDDYINIYGKDSWGNSKFDKMLMGGFEKGQHYVFHTGRSYGKSSFMINHYLMEQKELQNAEETKTT